MSKRRMLVLCPFPQGLAAGQRLKYEQYLDDWRRAGWEVTVSPFMDRLMWDVVYTSGRTLRKAAGVLRGELRRLRDYARVGRYDLVYVHMNVTPLGTAASERLVRARARKLVYDVEDDLTAPSAKGAAAAGKSVNPIARFLRGRGKPRFLISHADHVVTASPFLVDRFRALNAYGRCTMIPPSVDTDTFAPANRPPNDKVIIGWTGTFSSEPYLDLLRPVFQKLAKRVDFRLRVIGNFTYALPGVDLEVVTWSKEREAEDMQAIDIGVYPLPFDDWVLGKAGLKVIQYMAFGIPSVSSDVGAASLQIRDGDTGFLVKSEDEWVDRLERLACSAELRASMGARARAEALNCYSRRAVSGRYLAMLDQAMAGGDHDAEA